MNRREMLLATLAATMRQQWGHQAPQRWRAGNLEAAGQQRLVMSSGLATA